MCANSGVEATNAARSFGENALMTISSMVISF